MDEFDIAFLKVATIIVLVMGIILAAVYLGEEDRKETRTDFCEDNFLIHYESGYRYFCNEKEFVCDYQKRECFYINQGGELND